MKALNAAELVSLCEWLKERLVGAQLQDLWTDGERLVLQFYRQREIFVVISLHPQAPILWLQNRKPRVKKSPKPVTLFLASHGRGRVLQDLEVDLRKGRCVLWTLGSRDIFCELELDLIPKNPNLVVRAAGKQIWWNKPKDLPPPVLPEMEKVVRDWEAWSLEMSESLSPAGTAEGPQGSASAGSPSLAKGGKGDESTNRAPVGGQVSAKGQNSESSSELHEATTHPSPATPTNSQPSHNPALVTLKRAIQKKEKALIALAEQLQSNEAARHRQLGESLKSSPEIPAELLDLYDNTRTPIQNMEKMFHKAKEIERKRQGTLNRQEIIKQEIAKLQKDLARGEPLQGPQQTAALRAMKKGEAQGRKLVLDGGFEAVIGKSGADNLAILRQARAWDYWLHLKDEPGAHAILFRNRNQEVPLSIIQKVAEWIWSESKGRKSAPPGGRYEVLVVECRFVKPIKGDRLGRVNYQNPQVYSFASKSSS